MFFRTIASKGHQYLVVAESYRADGKVKQKIVANFGRLDALQESGALDRLIESSTRFSEKLAVIGESVKNKVDPLEASSIGPSMVFGKIWRNLGIDAVLKKAAQGRRFGFDPERVCFAAVLQRLTKPGSDRQASISWFECQNANGLEKLEMQHLYRTMKWLGTPVDADDLTVEESEAENEAPASKRARSVPCTKDVLEEAIFFNRSNLFTGLELVFFDTTSIYFEGEGGTEIGQRGHSKDHRPDLPQIVVGLVLDDNGYPVCTEMWPGNTSDVTTLIPVAERLKSRFNIGKVCIVADRGMISKETVSHIKSMGWNYILGARMRQVKEIRDIVINDESPYSEIQPERENKSDPAPLKVKEVIVNETRYIVCVNEEEARKDKHDRENILAKLKEALKKGDKNLVGNKGYKRFIASGNDGFAIDENLIADDARYDGKFVLTSDTELKPDEIAMQYKNLLTVESAFRAAKSLLNTRPVYHHNDANIKGHIWCSFLALLLRKTLMDAIGVSGGKIKSRLEWSDVINDLNGLTVSKLKSGEKEFEIRSKAGPGAVRAFAALNMRLPEIVKQIMPGNTNQNNGRGINFD
jgi:hypothetical protein